MTVQHVNLTHDDVHEPKHITNAQTNKSGYVITPSATTDYVSELRRLTGDDIDDLPFSVMLTPIDGTDLTSGTHIHYAVVPENAELIGAGITFVVKTTIAAPGGEVSIYKDAQGSGPLVASATVDSTINTVDREYFYETVDEVSPVVWDFSTSESERTFEAGQTIDLYLITPFTSATACHVWAVFRRV